MAASGEQKVTPWEARAAEGAARIDFDKLIRKIFIGGHVVVGAWALNPDTSREPWMMQVNLEV